MNFVYAAALMSQTNEYPNSAIHTVVMARPKITTAAGQIRRTSDGVLISPAVAGTIAVCVCILN